MMLSNFIWQILSTSRAWGMELWTETYMVPGGTGSAIGETDLLYERMRHGSEGQCAGTHLVAEGRLVS